MQRDGDRTPRNNRARDGDNAQGARRARAARPAAAAAQQRRAPKPKRSKVYRAKHAYNVAPTTVSVYDLPGPIYNRAPQFKKLRPGDEEARPVTRTRVNDIRVESRERSNIEWVRRARQANRQVLGERIDRKEAIEATIGGGARIPNSEVPYFRASALGVKRAMTQALSDKDYVTQIAAPAAEQVGFEVSDIVIELLRRASVYADVSKMVTIRPEHIEAAYRAMTNDV